MRQSTTGRRTIHRKHLAFSISGTGTSNVNVDESALLVVTAGEAITEGNAVVVTATEDGLRAFNASNHITHYHYAGIASSSASSGSSCPILTVGVHESLRYNFTPGDILYVTSGELNISGTLLPHQHTYQIAVALTQTAICIKPDVRVINRTGV